MTIQSWLWLAVCKWCKIQEIHIFKLNKIYLHLGHYFTSSNCIFMQLQGIVFIQLQGNDILVNCQGNIDSFKMIISISFTITISWIKCSYNFFRLKDEEIVDMIEGSVLQSLSVPFLQPSCEEIPPEALPASDTISSPKSDLLASEPFIFKWNCWAYLKLRVLAQDIPLSFFLKIALIDKT